MAFTLLTRLPLGWLAPAERERLGRSVWAYPLVGAAVGAIGAAVYWSSWRVGLPASLGAVCTLAAGILVTGALHEDGLADTADGFGGGNTPGRKLEIMRDSRIGTYGALALMLSLAARASAIAAIAQPGRVAAALIGAGALGRGGLAIVILLAGPARADGLGAGLGRPSGARALAGAGLGLATAWLVLPSSGIALGVALAALGTAVAMSRLARRQIGGYTGDVLGATVVAIECMVLGVLVSTGIGPT
ncbi:MAG TPA: adenosylcobinamide-GDP ribazoletransferase [Acetobacteraceae bacterium]|nr:adenosylcobinamide-GDP ribazoletransferase [Acetobacteraceae bacterium]